MRSSLTAFPVYCVKFRCCAGLFIVFWRYCHTVPVSAFSRTSFHEQKWTFENITPAPPPECITAYAINYETVIFRVLAQLNNV